MNDDEEYDDVWYNDGRFLDNEEDDEEEYDIPTYDELDLEGRYYIHGSRASYNEWRQQEIQNYREANRIRPSFIPRKEPTNHVHMFHAPDERYASDIPTYKELSETEKKKFASRDEYNNWRNDYIDKRNERRRRDKEIRYKVETYAPIAFIALPFIILFLYLYLK